MLRKGSLGKTSFEIQLSRLKSCLFWRTGNGFVKPQNVAEKNPIKCVPFSENLVSEHFFFFSSSCHDKRTFMSKDVAFFFVVLVRVVSFCVVVHPTKHGCSAFFSGIHTSLVNPLPPSPFFYPPPPPPPPLLEAKCLS